jgi:hypothetical protein
MDAPQWGQVLSSVLMRRRQFGQSIAVFLARAMKGPSFQYD